MRYLIANWKMNLNSATARELAAAIRPAARADLKVIVAPSFTLMEGVAGTLAGEIELAAQNIYPAEEGAFTGETGLAQLEEFGVRRVIVGHSERRQLLNESDAFIRAKLEFLFARGLHPVLCVGETLAQRQAGEAEKIVTAQLQAALGGLKLPSGSELLIAYEPVWAIGTGVVAAPAEAAQMHSKIRAWLATRFKPSIPVLYGGSVSAANIAELEAGAQADGYLVGGASLKADTFLELARVCALRK